MVLDAKQQQQYINNLRSTISRALNYMTKNRDLRDHSLASRKTNTLFLHCHFSCSVSLLEPLRKIKKVRGI